VSEVVLQPQGAPEDDEEGLLQPIFLGAAAYEAFPAALSRLLEGLRTCDEAMLAGALRFPFSYDYVDRELSARAEKGAEVLSTIAFADAGQLARTCRSSPHEVPRAAKVGRLAALFEDLTVESPTQVAVLMPQEGGQLQQWWLAWDGGAWRLSAVRD
jgi:hypothetical protein